jgi:hypothetical protein
MPRIIGPDIINYGDFLFFPPHISFSTPKFPFLLFNYNFGTCFSNFFCLKLKIQNVFSKKNFNLNYKNFEKCVPKFLSKDEIEFWGVKKKTWGMGRETF